MGCAASKAAAASPPPTTERVPKPKPVAFEILVDETEASKEKKLPPQLLQRLEEQKDQNLTVEELRQKQQKAEERRQTILEEKCRIARQAQKMFNKGETPTCENKAEEVEGS